MTKTYIYIPNLERDTGSDMNCGQVLSNFIGDDTPGVLTCECKKVSEHFKGHIHVLFASCPRREFHHRIHGPGLFMFFISTVFRLQMHEPRTA